MSLCSSNFYFIRSACSKWIYSVDDSSWSCLRECIIGFLSTWCLSEPYLWDFDLRSCTKLTERIFSKIRFGKETNEYVRKTWPVSRSNRRPGAPAKFYSSRYPSFVEVWTDATPPHPYPGRVAVPDGSQFGNFSQPFLSDPVLDQVRAKAHRFEFGESCECCFTRAREARSCDLHLKFFLYW